MAATRLTLAAFAAVALTRCLGGGGRGGLGMRNPDDRGPQIVWNIDAEEVPFPNDIATRAELDAHTGRRVNVNRQAPTEHERRLRGYISELDGFGTSAPLSVTFDAPIDLAALHAVQTDADPSNDAIYLINVDRASPEFGALARIHLGSGPNEYGRSRFPLGLERASNYFRNDPRAGGSNLLFETFAEDANGNGVLEGEEDSDDDGVLDRPNTWGEWLQDGYARLADVETAVTSAGVDPAKFRQYADLISFYEMETNTLVFRPIMPLREATTYAVVLTRQILGMSDGSPIRSPFVWVNHLQQTAALDPVADSGLLAQWGVGLDSIAFAWSFTTQSITRDVMTLREGLYGTGPFARLAEQFPASISAVLASEDPSVDINVYRLSAGRLLEALGDPLFLDAMGLETAEAEPLFQLYERYADHFVFFSFDSPAFLADEDGVFQINSVTGEGSYGRESVTMSCVVPKAQPGHAQPFPVTFYSHGYTSSRMELLGFAASLAAFGQATCAIDAYGHGLPNSDFVKSFVLALLGEKKLGALGDALLHGRDRDLNHDGYTDSGGDFWSANTFHTRDVVRQTTVDYQQAVRVLRGFGAGTMPIDIDGDGALELNGDFDGDGTADLGGEQPIAIMGQSLGGIMAALVGPSEPMVRAAAPVSGGAGLGTLGLRTTQGGVVQAVFYPLIGPIVVSKPSETVPGKIDIVFELLDVNRGVDLPVASIDGPTLGGDAALQVGDVVFGMNLDNGETDVVTVRNASGAFRLQIAADRNDRLAIVFWRQGAWNPYRTISTFESAVDFQGESFAVGDRLRFLQDGFGFRRQTPSLRRLFHIAQMVLDPADPVNWMRHYADPLATTSDGAVGTNLLVVNTIGDMNVPIDTGIHLARAAGILSDAQDDALLDSWSVEALEDLRRLAADPCRYDSDRVLFDPDELSDGADPNGGPRPTLVSSNPACQADTPASFCTGTCAAEEPLRVTVSTDAGMSGMRIPYLNRRGVHGFSIPNPTLAFDYNLYQINQIGWFFATEGGSIVDDPCLANHTQRCAFFEME